MTPVDISFCVLILAGAFTLCTLGILLLRAATALTQIGKTVEVSQSTLKKVDTLLDDVTYKMDLLNAPVESLARLFDPNKPKFGFVTKVMKKFKK